MRTATLANQPERFRQPCRKHTSFFSTLKRELVHHESYAGREEARRSLFEYIEVFYNRTAFTPRSATGAQRRVREQVSTDPTELPTIRGGRSEAEPS